jgi:hypothetical protein
MSLSACSRPSAHRNNLNICRGRHGDLAVACIAQTLLLDFMLVHGYRPPTGAILFLIVAPCGDGEGGPMNRAAGRARLPYRNLYREVFTGVGQLTVLSGWIIQYVSVVKLHAADDVLI